MPEMKPWAKRPGDKMIVTRRFLEDRIHHLENPDMFAANQFRQDVIMIREQLADRTNVHEK